ncbi:MAG: Holliday junction resolvase RuvX [Burkholderiales bacterium]|nr:Holliday junction resolvase RuvX [Burkholderiales bacterium]
MHEAADRTQTATGTVLAFDYGTRRIGVAVGDLGQRSAHPLTTIDASDRAASEAKITALVDEWRPTRLVVGVPLSLDGREHQMTRSARAFGRALSRRHSLPVDEVDERLTSVDAEATLREAGVDLSRRAGLVDAQAAFIILRAFLDTR